MKSNTTTSMRQRPSPERVEEQLMYYIQHKDHCAGPDKLQPLKQQLYMYMLVHCFEFSYTRAGAFFGVSRDTCRRAYSFVQMWMLRIPTRIKNLEKTRDFILYYR